MASQTELLPGAAGTAPAGQAAAAPQGKRLLFIDNLRILLICMVLVGFAYAFHVVTLYPLLKWAIAILFTLPLCFLISGVIRKTSLVNRAL